MRTVALTTMLKPRGILNRRLGSFKSGQEYILIVPQYYNHIQIVGRNFEIYSSYEIDLPVLIYNFNKETWECKNITKKIKCKNVKKILV